MSLGEILTKHKSDKSKKHFYDLIYEPFFQKVRYEKFNLLEIGVFRGESTAAWVEYFPNAVIYGVDIFERVSADEIEILKHPRVKWAKCDSTKSAVADWADITFKFIIDDGLHTPDANLKTFQNFVPQLEDSYFIEDVWPLHIMNEKELQHRWIRNKQEYQKESQLSLLNELNKHGTVMQYDHRSITNEPDSFIIQVQK